MMNDALLGGALATLQLLAMVVVGYLLRVDRK